MTKQNKHILRLGIAAAFFIVALLIPYQHLFAAEHILPAQFIAFAVPYLIAGWDVLYKAARNIFHGHLFDEHFLMAIASLGAFALVFFPEGNPHMAEGAAVMLFYQIGEMFQDYAVGKSRASIAEMMDIEPDSACVKRNGAYETVDPYDVEIGEELVVKPGERIPLDGIIVSGASKIDTSALTGESLPEKVQEGNQVISGCINLSSPLHIKTTKLYEDSTVARILELVENASEKKSHTENFITRFARWYTPLVVGFALALACIPPLLFGQTWPNWIERGLVFLVVSCPCALVISVPLSFFGGIGAASRQGILIKGSNYLEALSHTSTMAFDKTGTLTSGSFEVVALHPSESVTEEELLRHAAVAERFSNHPIAEAIRNYAQENVTDNEALITEIAGRGIKAELESHSILAGNKDLLEYNGITSKDCPLSGSIVHISCNGRYLGHIVVGDVLKPEAKCALDELRKLGVKKFVMLTGDRKKSASEVAQQLNVKNFKAELLPADKMDQVEQLLNQQSAKESLAFVGDGINDAPVLARADIGIAMGALGSDAAIEAADIVLMEDNLQQLPKALCISKKTMRIVWQNIIFALGVKFSVLGLATFGLANMWLAVFADVGVTCIAIINSMRMLKK